MMGHERLKDFGGGLQGCFVACAILFMASGCCESGVEHKARTTATPPGLAGGLREVLTSGRPLTVGEVVVLRNHLKSSEQVYGLVIEYRHEIIRWEDWAGAVQSGMVPSAYEFYQDVRLPGPVAMRSGYLASFLHNPQDSLALKIAAALAGNQQTRVVVTLRSSLAKMAMAQQGSPESYMIAYALYRVLDLGEDVPLKEVDIVSTPRDAKVIRTVCKYVLSHATEDLSPYITVDDAVAVFTRKRDKDDVEALFAEARLSPLVTRRLRYHARRDKWFYRLLIEKQPRLLRYCDIIHMIESSPPSDMDIILEDYGSTTFSFPLEKIEMYLSELIRRTDELAVVAAIAWHSTEEFVKENSVVLARVALNAIDDGKAEDAWKIAVSLSGAVEVAEGFTLGLLGADETRNRQVIKEIRQFCQDIINRRIPGKEQEG